MPGSSKDALPSAMAPQQSGDQLHLPLGHYAYLGNPFIKMKGDVRFLNNVLDDAHLPPPRERAEMAIWLILKASVTEMPSPGRTLINNWAFRGMSRGHCYKDMVRTFDKIASEHAIVTDQNHTLLCRLLSLELMLINPHAGKSSDKKEKKQDKYLLDVLREKRDAALITLVNHRAKMNMARKEKKDAKGRKPQYIPVRSAQDEKRAPPSKTGSIDSGKRASGFHSRNKRRAQCDKQDNKQKACSSSFCAML